MVFIAVLGQDEVKHLLGLHGYAEHLFELLQAHEHHQHADRHLATHIAYIQVGSTLIVHLVSLTCSSQG